MPFVHIFEDDHYDEDGEGVESKPEDFSYEKPELGDDSLSASILNEKKSGLFSELAGTAVQSFMKLSPADTQTLKTFMPALKEAGVTRCIVSYDGGSDEGFGRFKCFEDADGNEIEKSRLLDDETLVAALTPFVTERYATNQHRVFRNDDATPDAASLIDDYFEFELPVLLASRLIGKGYGTGEYELYGRAVADLNTMTITDDPEAPYPYGPSD